MGSLMSAIIRCNYVISSNRQEESKSTGRVRKQLLARIEKTPSIQRLEMARRVAAILTITITSGAPRGKTRKSRARIGKLGRAPCFEVARYTEVLPATSSRMHYHERVRKPCLVALLVLRASDR